MGTKYTTISISNYNASPPPDDGSQVSANKVDWSKVKTKLGDPLNTAITSINSSLVTHFDQGPTLKTATYTTTAADYNSVLEVTGTTTITLLSAATGGAGYNVTVKNSGVAVVTVASSDNIDGNASVTLSPDDSAQFMVAASGTTYHSLRSSDLPDTVGPAGQKLISDGTNAAWTSSGWEYVDKLDSFDSTTQAEFTDLTAGYDHMFELVKVRAETTNVSLVIRTSTDNGSSYDNTSDDYREVLLYGGTASAAAGAVWNISTATYLRTTPFTLRDTGDHDGVTGVFVMPNLGAGIYQAVQGESGFINTAGNLYTVQTNGYRKSTTAVDAVEFSMTTDQIASGAIYHYRKKVGS